MYIMHVYVVQSKTRAVSESLNPSVNNREGTLEIISSQAPSPNAQITQCGLALMNPSMRVFDLCPVWSVTDTIPSRRYRADQRIV